MTNYEKEIRELHDFFAAWFNGTTDDFSRFEETMADDFTMITPHARAVRSRDDILNGVRQEHGSRSDMRILIEEVRLLHDMGDGLVVSYIEKQATGERETARRSTVVFKTAPGLPNGLRWHHVHETWIEAYVVS